MSSRGRAAQLGSSSLRKSYACSRRALLLGAGWSTAEVKTRTGQDTPALVLLDRRNSPSFHKVSKSELRGTTTPQDYLALGTAHLAFPAGLEQPIGSAGQPRKAENTERGDQKHGGQ